MVRKKVNELRDKNGWISCKQAMPEDVLDLKQKRRLFDLLVTKDSKRVVRLCRVKYGDTWMWSGNNASTVIAWQPLPERYVEE